MWETEIDGPLLWEIDDERLWLPILTPLELGKWKMLELFPWLSVANVKVVGLEEVLASEEVACDEMLADEVAALEELLDKVELADDDERKLEVELAMEEDDEMKLEVELTMDEDVELEEWQAPLEATSVSLKTLTELTSQ